jgi:hypothetical protein
MKGFRKDISRTLDSIEAKMSSSGSLERERRVAESTSIESGWQIAFKQLGEQLYGKFHRSKNNCLKKKYIFQLFIENELNNLRYQTSDDMNDCIKYISAINDKLNHIEILQQNQHTYAE